MSIGAWEGILFVLQYIHCIPCKFPIKQTLSLLQYIQMAFSHPSFLINFAHFDLFKQHNTIYSTDGFESNKIYMIRLL